VTKSNLAEKIKNHELTPEGTLTHTHALTALRELNELCQLKDLDPKAKTAAKEELTQVVADYRRGLKRARFFRKKRTRG
jgi:hypothetical protein